MIAVLFISTLGDKYNKIRITFRNQISGHRSDMYFLAPYYK